MVIKLLQYTKMAFLKTVNYTPTHWISLSRNGFTSTLQSQWVIDNYRSGPTRKGVERKWLLESLTLGALRKWWTLWCYSFCVLLLQSPHIIEDHCFQVKWATDHLIQTVTIGHWRIPASEVILPLKHILIYSFL